MNQDNAAVTTADADDARLRALFGAMDAPPMGDERFTASVMAEVDAIEARRTSRKGLLALGAIAIGAMGVVANATPLADAFADAYAAYALYLPNFGAGATSVMLAMAAAGAGWLYSERG